MFSPDGPLEKPARADISSQLVGPYSGLTYDSLSHLAIFRTDLRFLIAFGCFYKLGCPFFVGFATTRALAFEVHIGAPDVWKLPFLLWSQ